MILLKFCFPPFFHRDAPPLLPSDTTQGYRTVKAKLGCKKVRPWKWMPFTNPARKDGAIFHHWRRMAEEGKDYPFARFNKVSLTDPFAEIQDKHMNILFGVPLFKYARTFMLNCLLVFFFGCPDGAGASVFRARIPNASS